MLLTYFVPKDSRRIREVAIDWWSWPHIGGHCIR